MSKGLGLDPLELQLLKKKKKFLLTINLLHLQALKV